ncbi:MAG TPA: SprT family zinc-dependent metalloprotease [Nordella sp.]|nr:SprT family zinc-dependent metalloprotease [Nordella sp.]
MKRPKTIEPALLAIDGKSISVAFRRHAKARRLVLRLSRDRSGVIVTLPPRVGRSEALDFAKRSAGWIADRLAAEPAKRPVEAGATILLRGEIFRVMPAGSRRGGVVVQGDTLLIAGDEAHIERRLVDWLKAEARRDLVLASEAYALAMGVNFHRVTVRDQKSRWGSCSSDGTLSYSWRLVLAPPFVLDYVAAHEVAHLKHMNHGRQFWRLVLTHCSHAARAKTWLRQHGAELHAYAAGP